MLDLQVLGARLGHAAGWYSLVSPLRIGLRRTLWSARLITCGEWVSAWAGCKLPERPVWPRGVEMVQVGREDSA